jgi:enoyl-CoA hydratase/carnithine racemase
MRCSVGAVGHARRTQLALVCDVRIAAAHARCAFREGRLGDHPQPSRLRPAGAARANFDLGSGMVTEGLVGTEEHRRGVEAARRRIVKSKDGGLAWRP